MQKFALGLLLAASFCAQAQVYKWTDDKGTVHFSAQPPAHQKTEHMQAVKAKVTPALREFCAHLRARVPSLVSGAAYDATRDERLRRVGLDADSLSRMGFSQVDLDRLDGAAEGYRGAEMNARDLVRAADDIHGRCIAGAYGDVQLGNEVATTAPTRDGRPADLDSSGTGFLISSELVATSFHVVAGSHLINLHLSDGSEASATILSMDRSKDLAVLKMQRPSKLRFLRVASETVGLGADVFTIGFPQPDLMGVEPKLSVGVISSTSGIQDDIRTYQISVPVQAGNSGGPLVDSSGVVVGIVASKLNAAKVFEWTGDLPQNVNYAVKSTYLSRLIHGEVLRSATAVAGTGVQGKAPAVREAVVLIEVH